MCVNSSRWSPPNHFKGSVGPIRAKQEINYAQIKFGIAMIQFNTLSLCFTGIYTNVFLP